MNNIFNFIKKNNIGNPPWDYYFLQNLDEKEYPKYLAKLFYLNTGEKLPLSRGVIDKKRCKTFNQKLQWIKLYGVTPLMRDCTDKVKVRDYVKEKIGGEYLKPVLQVIPSCHSENLENQNGNSVDFQVVQNLKKELKEEKMLKHACINDKTENKKINHTAVQHDRPLINFITKSTDVSTYFDRINWDKLPNAFVIKTNHGCKWQYIIKDKNLFLQNKRLIDIVKQQMTGWLEQEYFPWNGFEMQYKDIKSKIIIEKLFRNKNIINEDLEVYCFNGIPKIIRQIHNNGTNNVSLYDENFNKINIKFLEQDIIINKEINEILKQTIELSKKLSKDFSFVRVDWLIFEDKFYFNELTFTPFSGFCHLDKKWNKQLGNFINLKGNKNEF